MRITVTIAVEFYLDIDVSAYVNYDGEEYSITELEYDISGLAEFEQNIAKNYIKINYYKIREELIEQFDKL